MQICINHNKNCKNKMDKRRKIERSHWTKHSDVVYCQKNCDNYRRFACIDQTDVGCCEAALLRGPSVGFACSPECRWGRLSGVQGRTFDWWWPRPFPLHPHRLFSNERHLVAQLICTRVAFYKVGLLVQCLLLWFFIIFWKLFANHKCSTTAVYYCILFSFT